MPIDPQAENRWDRANHAYEHYHRFIAAKPNPYVLTFADLAFVKNFKGGMALIAEPVDTFAAKLRVYQDALNACAIIPAFACSFSNMDNADYCRVKKAIVAFATLPTETASHIAGFGSSFASALLHFYFPKIVPILDKRALNGSRVHGLRKPSGKIVTNILPLYSALIDAFHARLQQDKRLTLRDLDREWFIERL